MSQHDLDLANQNGASFRADVNAALQALGSLSSGATAPSTTYGQQLWHDLSNNIIRQRNSANSAWITRLTGRETIVRQLTGPYTVVLGDFGCVFNCTNPLTLSLTTASLLSDGFWFGVRNGSSGKCVIDPNGAEVIGASTTMDLQPGEAILVFCSGSAFTPIGYAINKTSATRVFAASATSLPNNVFTPVIWDSESFDDSGWWSSTPTPSRVIVTETGRYRIHGQVGFSTAQLADYSVTLNKSGVLQNRFEGRFGGSGNSFPFLSVSNLVDASASEYFEIQAWQNTGASVNTVAGTTSTYVIVERIK